MSVETESDDIMKSQEWAKMAKVLNQHDIDTANIMSWNQMEDKYRELAHITGSYSKWYVVPTPQKKNKVII